MKKLFGLALLSLAVVAPLAQAQSADSGSWLVRADELPRLGRMLHRDPPQHHQTGPQRRRPRPLQATIEQHKPWIRSERPAHKPLSEQVRLQAAQIAPLLPVQIVQPSCSR